MSQRIIHPTAQGGVAVIAPAPCDLTIEEIARKDVPKGAPYFIVESSQLPSFDTQEGWEVDFTKSVCVITVNQAKLKAAPRRVTYAQWRALFTEAERAWAFDASRPATIRDLIAVATAENGVDLNSSGVAGFLDLCIQLGSPLTAARKTQILAGQSPA